MASEGKESEAQVGETPVAKEDSKLATSDGDSATVKQDQPESTKDVNNNDGQVAAVGPTAASTIAAGDGNGEGGTKEASGGNDKEDAADPAATSATNGETHQTVPTTTPPESTPPDASDADDPKQTAKATATVDGNNNVDDEAEKNTKDDANDIANSQGAKILLNRFSTWRQKTNENAQSLWSKQAPTLQENAKALWQRGPKFAQTVREITKESLDTAGGTASAATPAVATNTPSASESQNTDGDKHDADKSAQIVNEGKDDTTAADTTNGNTASSASASAATTTTKSPPPTPKKPQVMQAAASLFASMTKTATAAAAATDVTDEKSQNPTKEHAAGQTDQPSKDAAAIPNDDANANSADTNADRADYEATRARVGVAVNRATVAASIVAESVATGFRGRYATSKSSELDGDGGKPPPESPRRKMNERESQTALILKSRAAKHMQGILDALEPHEFAMLLGKGMLGVNLKQCYLKNNGVFVDFLVPKGQAELSGVVRSGDLLVRLGDFDLRKGTIVEIPQTIAQAKRPVVLILATGTKPAMEKINYVDIGVAMMHRARDLFKERFVLGHQDDEDGDANGNNASNDNTEKKNDMASPSPIRLNSMPPLLKLSIPLEDSIDAFVSPPPVPMEVKKELVDEVAQRCNDGFLVGELIQIADLDNGFRATLNNAFLACAIDPRKLPFLTRHLSSSVVELENGEGKMTASAQLMLFLELHSFSDLHGVTPKHRIRDIAMKIAHKFFLPTKIGDELQPPLFDFHHIVPDSSLRHLEFVLSGTSKAIPRDAFLDFQRAIVESLVGIPFLTFLVSAECAKMRGYLRNTAPYTNLPLHTIVQHAGAKSADVNAKNSFVYILMYLLCRLEKEGIGDNGLFQAEGSRHFGSPSGLCCVLFIQGILLPQIEAIRKQSTGEKDGNKIAAPLDALKNTFERFWEAFVSSHVGSLQMTSKTNETESALRTLRKLLLGISGTTNASGTTKDAIEQQQQLLLTSLLDKSLENAIKRLSEELLYDHSVNTHLKFKEHKFHELMCSELCKRRVADSTYSHKQELQAFPPGCIKRLLRKVELPVGISAHKPSYGHDDATKTKQAAEPQSPTNVVNAEFAVVFGSANGEQRSLLPPIPSMEKSNYRRFLGISLGGSGSDSVDSLDPAVVPITLENYALVAPPKAAPFGGSANEMPTSEDGWSISLVNFIIPNGDSAEGDATESALFGVSLVLHKTKQDNGEGSANVAASGLKMRVAFQAKDTAADDKPKNAIEESPSTTTPDSQSTPDNGDNTKAAETTENATADGAEARDHATAKACPTNIVSQLNFVPLLTTSSKPTAHTASDDGVWELTLRMQDAPTFKAETEEVCWLKSVQEEQFVHDDADHTNDADHANSDNNDDNDDGGGEREANSNENGDENGEMKDENTKASSPSPITVGLSLACRQNTVPAMREVLSRLVDDFTRRLDVDATAQSSRLLFCEPLANLLGSFSNQSSEREVLATFLRPYMDAASSPWIERPIGSQKAEFELQSVRRMADCLPPTPLALMFVTALLEQKIVLSSTRRSMLHSVVTALAAMLRPLKWRHLLVPLVPARLASDLIQYPAPFILGVCSEDADSLGLLGSLPQDVTLVDLDVGRVILAPSFGHDNEMVTKSANAEVTMRALRSQALYLAQSLGRLFGAQLSPDSWNCDTISRFAATNPASQSETGNHDPSDGCKNLMKASRSFIDELLAGFESCSYWMQEASTISTGMDEPTVLFDEDRFFHIKNFRSRKDSNRLFGTTEATSLSSSLALSIDDFDLILESFLRCQSISTYISSRPKEDMIYF